MNLIIWIVLVVVPIVGGMIMSGGIGQFIDIPSAFITIVPTIGALLVGFKGYFISSITSVWKKDVDNLTLVKGVEFWKAANKVCYCLQFFRIYDRRDSSSNTWKLRKLGDTWS